jgi:hypothetical protein
MSSGGAGGRPGTYGIVGAPKGPESIPPFTGGGDPDIYHHVGAGMSFSVQWDMTELQVALANAYNFLSNFPSAAIVNDQAAFGLKYSIQAHTPVGPGRDLGGSKAAQSGAYGSETNPRRYLTRWTRSQNDQDIITDDMRSVGKSMKGYLQEFERYGGAKSEGGRVLAAELRGLGYDPIKVARGQTDFDGVVRDVAKKRGLGGGKGGGRGGRGGLAMASAPGDANGNLFESIDVRCIGDGPNAVMHAQALSYYGWFVETGNRNVLKPKVPLRNEGYNSTYLPSWQLGDYPFVKKIQNWRKEAGAGETSTPYSVNSTDRQGNDTGSQESPWIRFDRADNGSNDGYHMVERGMEDFVTRLGLQWNGLAGRGLDAVWQGRQAPHTALAGVGKQMRRVSAPVRTNVAAFGGGKAWRGGNPSNTGQFSKKQD